MKLSPTIAVIIRAILFTLAINLPYLAESWRSSQLSPAAMNDSDEFLYLRVALDQGNYLPQEGVYQEHAKQLDLIPLLTHWRPDQTYLHFLFGRAAQLLGLRIVAFGLCLDLICGFAAYLVLFLFFRRLIGEDRKYTAELGVIWFLAYPLIFCFENWISFHPLAASRSAVFTEIASGGLAIQEGLETQISYLWFGLVLWLLLAAREAKYRSSGRLMLLGAIGGLMIYFYVLAWLMLVLFLVVFILIDGLSPDGEERLKAKSILVLKAAAIVSVTGALTALPAIIQIRSLTVFSDNQKAYSAVFYAPIELIIAAGGFLIISILGLFKNRLGLLWRLAAALIVTELIVQNVQPLTGVGIVGLFISGIYIRPLLNTVLFLFLFWPFSETSRFRYVLLALIVLLQAGALAASNFALRANSTGNPELLELIKYLRTDLPRSSVLAMATFNRPFSEQTKEWDWRSEPNAVASITENYLLKENWGLEWGSIPAEEVIERELALGTVLSGEPKLLRPCGAEMITEPKTLYFQQWIPVQLSRIQTCAKTAEIRKRFSGCDAFSRFRVDYLIWEPAIMKADPPGYLEIAGERVWRGGTGRFWVYRIDQQRARELFCAGS